VAAAAASMWLPSHCPGAAPGLSARGSKGPNGHETLAGPGPHPVHPCGAVQGQDRAVFLAPRWGGGSGAARPGAWTVSRERRHRAGISQPRTRAGPRGGAKQRGPSPRRLTRPFPRQEVMPAGRTARWTHPAPANPSTSGSSSKSCC